MTQPDADDLTPNREGEYQELRYHDEELEIRADDDGVRRPTHPPLKKNVNRRPPPRRRYYED